MDATETGKSDTRWVQRLDSYAKALKRLQDASEQYKLHKNEESNLLDVIRDGYIQAFEFTQELSWNLLKDYLQNQGFSDIHGSKDTYRLAFREGYIDEGEVWMDMIRSRNNSSHTYDEAEADNIIGKIENSYISEFQKLEAYLNARK
jgi:nucleotidyltransferase substrate binding protein (TIGR01987 family)